MSERFSFVTLRPSLGGVETNQVVLTSLPSGVRIYLNEAAEQELRASNHPYAQSLSATVDDLRTESRQKHRRRWMWLIGKSIVALPAAWLIYVLLIHAVVVLIPPRWEAKFGKMISPQDSVTDSFVRKTIDDIGTRLLQASPKQPYSFHFRVVPNKTVNAFALPGGYITLHSALLEAAESPEELAGVMAHEMVHVLDKHGLHGLLHDTGLLMIIDGLFTGGGASAGYLGAQLLTLSYSRTNERDADRKGMQMLVRAGISPEGMVHFFEKLDRNAKGHKSAWVGFLRTHPMDTERTRYLREMAGQTPKMQPLAVDWKKFKEKASSPAVPRQLKA